MTHFENYGIKFNQVIQDKIKNMIISKQNNKQQMFIYRYSIQRLFFEIYLVFIFVEEIILVFFFFDLDVNDN